MASDFNKPVVGDTYTAILPSIVTSLQDLARGLDPTLTGTSTNIPTGTKRFTESTSKWERYNGTAWADMATTYAISISGNAATATSATTAGSATTATTATNLAGGAAGGIVWQSASGTSGFSAAGTAGQALLSGGTGVPTWGTLSVGAGGTGATSFTAGSILAGNGTGAISLATAAQIVTALGSTAVGVASALTTTNNYQVNSFGVGTAGSGTAGEIRATNNITAYYTSDIRLKTNVKSIDSCLDKVAKLRGVYFDWKDEVIKARGGDDGYFVRTHDIGVIAQEVEAVVPEAVGINAEGFKAVRYELIIPLLINAINELRQEIKDLKG